MRQLGRRAGWRSRARWWVAGTCITTVLVATDTGSGAVDALIVGKVVRCPDPVRIACPVVRNVLVEALDARHHVVAADAVANGHEARFPRRGLHEWAGWKALDTPSRAFQFAAHRKTHITIKIKVKSVP